MVRTYPGRGLEVRRMEAPLHAMFTGILVVATGMKEPLQEGVEPDHEVVGLPTLQINA